MKKIILLLGLMLLSAATFAQRTNELDEQLAGIDTSSVTSGIIYERVFAAANLYGYNQDTTFNTAGFTYFKQALSEMHRASNGTKFIPVDLFKKQVKVSTTANEVNLAILNTDFNILNYNEDDPPAGGLLYDSIANTFTAIAGRQPFFMLHNTVIAPAANNVTGTYIVYKTSNEMYFNNGTKNIKNLVADFGDGISRTLIHDGVLNRQKIRVNYARGGTKVSRYTITYADNTILTTFGTIFLQFSPPGSSSACAGSADLLRENFTLQADTAFGGYNDTDPEIKAKIEYREFYANAHTDKKLRKPIIIVDGFDPGDKRKIEDCDCADNADCAAANTTNGVFNAANYQSLVDLMTYYDASILHDFSLLARLRTLGYDVIVVNFPKYETTNLRDGESVTIDGGSYYIESNAYALVKLLQVTNAKLIANGSTEKITLIGPSMGGQISRFALSYMEKNGIDHNTGLWISVDSPHLGANIPLGLQALLYRMKDLDIDEAADFYDNQLSSPAGQQQLIEFYVEDNKKADQDFINCQTISQGMPEDRGNTYFQQHYNSQNTNGLPNSGGWPQNLRKIAMVNGSLTGSKETVRPDGTPNYTFAADGEMVLNIRGFQTINLDLIWPLVSQTFTVHIASLEAQFMPTYTPSYKRIARFKKTTSDKRSSSVNNNIRGVMDNVPGGYFDAQRQVADPTLAQSTVPGIPVNLGNNGFNTLGITNIIRTISNTLGGSHWYLHEYNPIHSFVPTFSALAHLEPDQNWNNPLNTNLVCDENKLTPFDSYYGADKNTDHVSFTKESVDWLLLELDGDEQEPHFPVDADALGGPDAVCFYNATFSFSDVCRIPGAVASWSVSSNLIITGTNDYGITVKSTSSTNSGPGTITAVFENGVTVIREVWVGKPQNAIMGGIDNTIAGSISSYYAETDGATSYNWTLPPPYSIVPLDFNMSSPNWQLKAADEHSPTILPYTGTAGHSGFVTVEACNACGCSDTASMAVHSSSTGIGLVPWVPEDPIAGLYFRAAPNPSNTYVNIFLEDNTREPLPGALVSGHLYDFTGQPVQNVVIINNQATIDVHGLRKGLYTLMISIDGSVETHLIGVN